MQLKFASLIIFLTLILFEINLPASYTNKIIVVKCVGDIMMGTLYKKPILPPNDGKGIFDGVKDYLKNCDILIGNLEGTFTTVKKSWKRADNIHSFAFKMPVHYVNYLKEAGFTVLNIANNHARDFYVKGLKETISILTNNGLLYTGMRNQLTTLNIRGVKVGIAGFYWQSYFNSIRDLRHTRRFLKKCKSKVDILIVTFHGGSEGLRALHTKNRMEYFHGAKRGNVVKFARTAIDSGADFVFGHGPHVPRAMEIYKNKLIAYSLGNFCGYGLFRMEGPRKYSLILEVHLTDKGEFYKARIIPVILKNKGIPFYDPEKNVIKLIKKLTKTDFPFSPIEITDDGEILLKNK